MIRYIHHIFWLLVFFSLLGYSLLSGTYENWIYWPAAHILSQWALTWPLQSLFNQFSRLPRAKQYLPIASIAILYTISTYLLEGILILTLERLLEYPEHIQLLGLMDYYSMNWFQTLRGFAWLALYGALLQLIKTEALFDYEKRKNIEQSGLLGSWTIEKLTLQLNPHFLFNSMNSIAMMIRRGEKNDAIIIISKLNNLLREILYGDPEHTWTLAEEIRFIENLIDLEKMRFGEDLEVHTSFSVANPSFKIPKLLLQPILENAFKHGLSLDGKGVVKIAVWAADQQLHCEIFNSGEGSVPKNYLEKAGIGLKNTMQRLKHFYQERFTLKIEDLNEGTKVTLLLPYESN